MNDVDNDNDAFHLYDPVNDILDNNTTMTDTTITLGSFEHENDDEIDQKVVDVDDDDNNEDMMQAVIIDDTTTCVSKDCLIVSARNKTVCIGIWDVDYNKQRSLNSND